MQTVLIIAFTLKWLLCFISVCVRACAFKSLQMVFPHLSIIASQGFFLVWFGFWLKSEAGRSRRLLLSPRKGGDGPFEADGSMKRFQ